MQVTDNKINEEKNLHKKYEQIELKRLKNLMTFLKTDFLIKEDYAQWLNHTNHVKQW